MGSVLALQGRASVCIEPLCHYGQHTLSHAETHTRSLPSRLSLLGAHLAGHLESHVVQCTMGQGLWLPGSSPYG